MGARPYLCGDLVTLVGAETETDDAHSDTNQFGSDLLRKLLVKTLYR